MIPEQLQRYNINKLPYKNLQMPYNKSKNWATNGVFFVIWQFIAENPHTR